MRARLTPLLVTLTVAAAAGCATKGDVTSLRRSMNAGLDSLRASQDSVLVEMRRLRQALVEQQEESASLTRTRTSELERRIGELREQVAQLTQLTGQAQRTMRRRLDRIAERIEGGGAAAGGGGDVSAGAGAGGAVGADTAAAADTVAGDTTSAASGSAESPASLYETGVQQYRRGAYETARIALEELLSAHPRHELAPDAQFFLARTYQDAGEPRRALEEFQRVLELYPNSDRASSALYQRGRIHTELGNTGEARSAFEQVLRGFPSSPEAELAQERLNELGGGGASSDTARAGRGA